MFAFDVAAASLNEQLKRIEALDAKAGILIAADGVLAGFLLASDGVLRRAPLWIGVAITAVLFASIALALGSFANRKYETAPTPAAVVGLMGEGGENWLKWRFLANLLNAVDINRPKLQRKVRLLSSAVALLLLVVLILGAYLSYALIKDG